MSNKDIFSVKVYGVAANSWVLNWKGCWLLRFW